MERERVWMVSREEGGWACGWVFSIIGEAWSKRQAQLPTVWMDEGTAYQEDFEAGSLLIGFVGEESVDYGAIPSLGQRVGRIGYTLQSLQRNVFKYRGVKV